eukprot:1161529-Pelagomonas_calceolata.AAC.19
MSSFLSNGDQLARHKEVTKGCKSQCHEHAIHKDITGMQVAVLQRCKSQGYHKDITRRSQKDASRNVARMQVTRSSQGYQCGLLHERHGLLCGQQKQKPCSHESHCATVTLRLLVQALSQVART